MFNVGGFVMVNHNATPLASYFTMEMNIFWKKNFMPPG